MKKLRRIAGLGEGPDLRKAINLAIRHPDVEVAANDLLTPEWAKKLTGTNYKTYLRQKGLHTKPPNLIVASGKRAVEFLQAEKPNSFDHLYAHFLLQHLSFQERKRLYLEIWRTLRPGTSFVTLEEMHQQRYLPLELRRAGFAVSVRKLKPEDVVKFDTFVAKRNAEILIEARNQNLTVQDLERAIQQIKQNPNYKNYAINPEDSQEEREAKTLVRKGFLKLLDKDTCFVLVYAKKPKVRLA